MTNALARRRAARRDRGAGRTRRATAFLKFGRKHANTPAVVTVAARVRGTGPRRRRPDRARRGRPAPDPRPAGGAALVGTNLEADVDRVGRGRGRARNAAPFTDAIATEWYRRRMVGLFVGRALERRGAGRRRAGAASHGVDDRHVRARRPRGRGHGPAHDDPPVRAALPARLHRRRRRAAARAAAAAARSSSTASRCCRACCPVEDVAGRRVTTLESLTPAEGLHPIQQAFVDANAFQCGYCTPGMVMVAKALLDHNPAPVTRRDRGGAGRQHLPLHRLPADHRGRSRKRRGRSRRPEDRPDERRLHVVGRSVARSDAVGHVTGRTQYTADRSFPGMLHLKMVRSPLHHARIRGVDLSEAERVPGFVRALTAADVPHNVYTILGLIGVEPEEEFVLAEERVRYKGEPIVAIVAETEAAALEAVSRVRLDLEELPAVFDVEEALRPGAPIVTHWGNNTFMYEGHPCRRVRLGDVEAAFARGRPHRRGRLQHRARSSTPRPRPPAASPSRRPTAGTPSTRTRRRSTSASTTPRSSSRSPATGSTSSAGTVGGGFGGKVDVIVEPIATLAAMKTNRPVRLRLQPRGGDAGVARPAARGGSTSRTA